MTQPVSKAFATLFLMGSLLLGGCAPPWEVRPPATAVAGKATLVLHPDVRAGASRRTQTVVSAHTADAVDHVRVQIFYVSPGREDAVLGPDGPLMLEIQRSQLDRPIVLSQLHPQTHYRVYAWAYDDPDESPQHLISQEASVDVVVGDDDRPTVAPLSIRLLDVPFDGRTSLPGFDIVPGGYVPDGIEDIKIPLSEWVQASLPITWIGLEGDLMSKRHAQPDGLTDARLRVTVTLPDPSVIRSISLIGLDQDGEQLGDRYWSTWEYVGFPNDRLLGVSHQGAAVNPGFLPRLGTFAGTVEFDLFVYDEGDFTPGQPYKVEVHLANGTVLYDLFTVPGTEEGGDA